MCGIVGLWQATFPIDEASLNTATSLLQHRGPECLKNWISANRTVGLGHARLSIVDLITGFQPLHSADGLIHAVVNGEFYDDVAIRQEMIKKGYHFATLSDSEILLALYQEYGYACFDYLNGEFAFILIDERKNQLFAARDRFGIKPLFYCFYQNSLYIASEIKAILSFGVPARWDEDSLWLQFARVPLNHQSTFKNIQQIRPGHYMTVNLVTGNKRELPYWDLNFPAAYNRKKEKSEKEYIIQFHDLFQQAVRRRLRADVPVGCYLSGGIDSSTTLLMMADLLPQQAIDAFSIVFAESKELNEYNYASLVARKTGANFHSFEVTTDDITDNYANTVWHVEQCFIVNGCAPVAKYLLSHYVHALGFKVVLVGEGPDELLGGYLPLWWDCVKYSHFPENKQSHHEMQHFDFSSVIEPGQYLIHHRNRKKIIEKLGYYPAFLEMRPNTIETLLDPDFLKRYTRKNEMLPLLKDLSLDKKISPANLSLYLWCKSRFPVWTLTELGDRTEMAHALEARHPFLDRDMVHFLSQLPLHYKARGKVEKYILKQAMRKALPASIYKRRKHPFSAPSFLMGPQGPSTLYKLMQEVFHSGLLDQVPFANVTATLKLIDRLPNYSLQEVEKWGNSLHTLLSACLLVEKFRLKKE